MVPPVVHSNLRAVCDLYFGIIIKNANVFLYKENVLIGDKGQPLISDFALAKVHNIDLE